MRFHRTTTRKPKSVFTVRNGSNTSIILVGRRLNACIQRNLQPCSPTSPLCTLLIPRMRRIPTGSAIWLTGLTAEIPVSDISTRAISGRTAALGVGADERNHRSKSLGAKTRCATLWSTTTTTTRRSRTGPVLAAAVTLGPNLTVATARTMTTRRMTTRRRKRRRQRRDEERKAGLRIAREDVDTAKEKTRKG